MTQAEKIEYLRLALAMQGIGLRPADLDKALSTYELILKKQGDLTLKDIFKLEAEVEKRHKPKMKLEA